jgi:hypothetical protein
VIPELLAAAAVGISFSNAWMCIGLSFGTRGDGAAVGVRFIAGRILGLVLIGTAISAVGAIMEVPPIYFVGIFAAGSVLFGILMLVGIYGGPGPVKRRIRHALGLQRGERCEERRVSDQQGRVSGEGSGNRDGGVGVPSSLTPADPPVPAPSSPLPADSSKSSRGLKPTGAFLLGVMRGATPCVKLMVLAPLLIAVGPLWAVVLSLAYALSSSAYPIIGFLLASSVSYIPKYERAARVAGAAAMICIGLYMIVNESLLYVSPRGD